MAKSMRTPLLISGLGYFSHTHCWQVYKIKHTAMQSPWTNTGSGMGRTEELSDSTWHHHRIPPFQQVNSSNFCLLELPRTTVSAVIVKWKRLGATTAQPRSVRPHNLTERDSRVLKHEARTNHLLSVTTLTTEFQTASGSNVSTNTVRRELHEMGFYGWAAAHRPKFTMHNPKRQLEWCKAHSHETGAV